MDNKDPFCRWLVPRLQALKAAIRDIPLPPGESLFPSQVGKDGGAYQPSKSTGCHGTGVEDGNPSRNFLSRVEHAEQIESTGIKLSTSQRNVRSMAPNRENFSKSAQDRIDAPETR